jgi:hypothetical protein
MTNSKLIDSINHNIYKHQNLLKLICYSVICIFVLYAIKRYAFKEDNKLTCDNFILTCYLYMILALLIMLIIMIVMENILLKNMIPLNPTIVTIILITAMFAFKYILVETDPSNIAVSNLIWFLEILLISLFPIQIELAGSNPGSRLFQNLNDIIVLTGINSIIAVIIVGLLCTYFPQILEVNWTYWLGILLYTFLIVLIVGIFFITSENKLLKFTNIASVLGIIVFILLLLSNHSELIEHRKTCNDKTKLPNYPVESINLLYKVRRIFIDFFNLLAQGKIC